MKRYAIEQKQAKTIDGSVISSGHIGRGHLLVIVRDAPKTSFTRLRYVGSPQTMAQPCVTAAAGKLRRLAPTNKRRSRRLKSGGRLIHCAVRL